MQGLAFDRHVRTALPNNTRVCISRKTYSELGRDGVFGPRFLRLLRILAYSSAMQDWQAMLPTHYTAFFYVPSKQRGKGGEKSAVVEPWKDMSS